MLKNGKPVAIAMTLIMELWKRTVYTVHNKAKRHQSGTSVHKSK